MAVSGVLVMRRNTESDFDVRGHQLAIEITSVIRIKTERDLAPKRGFALRMGVNGGTRIEIFYGRLGLIRS